MTNIITSCPQVSHSPQISSKCRHKCHHSQISITSTSPSTSIVDGHSTGPTATEVCPELEVCHEHHSMPPIAPAQKRLRHIAFPIINWLLLLHSSCMEVLIHIISAHIRNIIWFDLIWLVELASLPYSTLFIIFYIWWVMQSMSAQQCRINQHCQCEYIYFLMHHLWSLLYFKLFSFGPEENEYRSQIVVKVTSLASFSIENNGKKKSKDGCNSVLKINIGRAIFLS